MCMHVRACLRVCVCIVPHVRMNVCVSSTLCVHVLGVSCTYILSISLSHANVFVCMHTHACVRERQRLREREKYVHTHVLEKEIQLELTVSRQNLLQKALILSLLCIGS